LVFRSANKGKSFSPKTLDPQGIPKYSPWATEQIMKKNNVGKISKIEQNFLFQNKPIKTQTSPTEILLKSNCDSSRVKPYL